MKKYITKSEFENLYDQARVITTLLARTSPSNTDALLNELDVIYERLGDKLVPDYIHGVIEGGRND